MGMPVGGGAGSIGAPPHKDYTELEASAAAVMMRSTLAIVANTLDVVFTQLGGNVWKYQSSADSPILPMFVMVGINYTFPSDKKGEIQTQYEALISDLSPEMQYELEEDKASIPRDPALEAFDNVIWSMASFLVGAQSANSVDPVVVADRIDANAVIGTLMIDQSLALTNEALAIIQNVLPDIDVNEGIKAGFDTLQANVSAITLAFQGDLNEIQNADAESLNGGLAQQLMSNMSTDITALTGLINDVQTPLNTALFTGVVDTIMSAAMLACSGDAQAVTAAAQMALCSSGAKESATGFVDPSINSLIDGIFSGIPDSPLKDALETSTTAAFIGLSTLSETS